MAQNGVDFQSSKLSTKARIGAAAESDALIDLPMPATAAGGQQLEKRILLINYIWLDVKETKPSLLGDIFINMGVCRLTIFNEGARITPCR